MPYNKSMDEPIEEPAPASARHWMTVAGAACMMTAGTFVFLSASILNPPLAEHLGVGLSEVMVYNSMMGVAGVLSMSFLAPWFYRAIGIRSAIVAGGLVMALSISAVVLVPNTVVLAALGFLTGLVFGMCTTMGASMLINTWFEARRGTMMGAVFALAGSGGIAAGLVLPPFVEGFGWQGGFLLMAGVLLALVVVPGLALIRSHPDRTGLRPFGAAQRPTAGGAVVLPGVPARRAFRTPQFVALAFGIVLFGVVQGIQAHFAPVMVERGVDLTVGGVLLSLMALTTVVSNIAVGTLNDRRGTLTAVLFALACQAIAMGGYVVARGFAPLAATTVVFAFSAAFAGVLIPILVALVFGMRDYATILGPTMAMMSGGVAVGTPLWGVAVDVTGSYTVALVAGILLSVVSAALITWVLRTAPALRHRVDAELGGPGGSTMAA